LQHYHPFSLPLVVLAAQVMAAALVSPGPEVAEAEAVVLLVVVAMAVAEQALAVEAQVLQLWPVLVRLLTLDHRQAQPQRCSLQRCRPL